MSRLRLFVMHQRVAWRALFRRRHPAVLDLESPENAKVTHPEQLCRCASGQPADVLADHDPGCRWVPAMCESCAGTGWCIGCGGDGTRPDWDPEKTPAERPSARRIA